jgi:hypothetical protein
MNKGQNFIEKAKNKFGSKYCYLNIDYIDSKTNVKIKCNIHDEYFKQKPSEHLRGKIGCNLCTKNPKVNTEYFIKKAQSIHGDKYDYSLTNYVNSYTKVIIICPIHGIFEQYPNNHYKQNCPECYNRNLTDKTFIDKSNNIHNNKYSYLNVEYSSSKSKIKITCKEHGEFEQKPNDHINGKGCPKCGIKYNYLENELKEYIKSLNIIFLENTKKIIPPLELDIYVPNKNIAIELNGLYWHSEIYKDNNYHLNKTNECELKNIKLIHIFEDEWINKKDIVKSRIKNILGLTTNKIYGRKTNIKEVPTKECKEFLINNHIQGNVNSSINIGLYVDNILMSLMTFGSLRKSMGVNSVSGNYELLRFCNKLDTTVIGGADKLLKYFIKTYNPIKIISYADRRWSQGNLYEKLNFKFIHNSKPSYYYIVNNNREYRFKYRKDVLIKEGYDENKSEHQIMKDRKIYRIYNCGSKRYELNIE